MKTSLDDPSRLPEIRRRIEGKRSLKSFYESVYKEYAACLSRCPPRGLILELGTGAGFAKSVLPGLVTSDVLPYEGIDLVADARVLPFPDSSIRLICMTNVFHHIPNVELFLREAERSLVTHGRLLVVDQHLGHISKPILKYIHREGYDPGAVEWSFPSKGPLSGANGALAWIVFFRDRLKFHRLFPRLQLVSYSCRMPLLYWLSGGLKRWNLVPAWLTGQVIWFDWLLTRCSSELGSWAFIEVVKRG